MKNNHEPDPMFLEKLQWQLESEGRRLRRLPVRSGRSYSGRNLMMIGLIILSVFSGFFASSTAAYFKDTSQRRLLLAKQEIRIRQHESRHKLLQVRQRDIMKKIDLGLLPPEEGNAINSDLIHSEIALDRLELDYQETEISSSMPQNDLSAPLFGGRDFVTERLQLQRSDTEEGARRLENDLINIRKNIGLGLMDSQEAESANLSLETIHSALNGIDRKIQLRKDFLEGNVTAKQVDLLGMVSEVESRLEELQAFIVHYRDLLAVQEKLFLQGRADNKSVLEAQYRLGEAESEQQIVQIELQILRDKMNDD